VQAWIIKPSNFNENKRYPLAFLIHGGPEDDWQDSWSTRWNPAVWAEQGYVVVMPNPTGSPGFGKDFVRGMSTVVLLSHTDL
jgi:dipeptidyl aminopeptidase/acylaminoacyl peptidase